MEVIIQLNNQTSGRDKLARLFQYTSKLVWHQLERRNANKYSVDRVKNLEQTLGSFRKILRMGRCIDFCYTALKTMHIEDPVIRFTLTTSKVAFALYLYADHIVWLSRCGFLKTDSDGWTKTANKFWLITIIANLLRDLYEIQHLLEAQRTSFLKASPLFSSSSDFEGTKSMNHFLELVCGHKDIFIDTLKNSCDLFIPLTVLGFTKLSPSTIGLLGAISSIAGLLTIIKPVVKLVPS